MIITAVINVHHCTLLVQVFLLVVRTCKIYSLSSFQMCGTVSLTIFTMLYVTSLWLIYFITEICTFTLFTNFLPSPLATTNLVSVSINSFLFYFLDSTYNWDHTVFVFVCLMYFRMIPSGIIHVVADSKISFSLVAE